jgi:hypothetical protein
MRYNRTAAVATAFVTAVAFPVLTAAGASARVAIPWTEETVFALSPTDSYIAEWMGLSSGWTIIGGPASRIYAGSAGVFAIDPSTGDISEYDGTPGEWTVIGGPGDEFAEGGGHLYGLGPNDDYVAEWNGTPNSWTIIGGPAGWIGAGPDGLIAGAPTGTSQDVWRYNNSPNNWSDISGPGAELVVGQNTIYKLNEDRNTVSQWAGGTNWTPILTQSDDEIAGLIAGDDGLFVSIDDSAGIDPVEFEYDGSPNTWTEIGGTPGPSPMAESRTNLFGVTDDSNGRVATVDVYSGSGTSWTVIGGPADPRLAAGD